MAAAEENVAKMEIFSTFRRKEGRKVPWINEAYQDVEKYGTREEE